MGKYFNGVRYTGPAARLVERCSYGALALVTFVLLNGHLVAAAHAIVDAVITTAVLLAAVTMIVFAVALIGSHVFDEGDATKALPVFGRIAKGALPAVGRALIYPLRVARDAWRSSAPTPETEPVTVPAD